MRMLTLVSILAICGAVAMAQTDAGVAFEVSSVKPAAPGARGMYINTSPGGRLTVTNMTLKEMIVLAWRVQPFQISGAGGWMDSDRFDLIAKPEAKPKDGELMLMLRALLADRFGLSLHSETKEMPVYALVLAKPGGKLGPGLVEAKEGSCAEIDRTKPPPPPEPGKPPQVFCGGFWMGPMALRGSAIPLSNFTSVLSRRLGRTVVDETGLKGKFDINLQLHPDEGSALPPGPGDVKPLPPPVNADSAIFTDIQEQMGLKLQSKKGPVEILVIDKAAKPEEN